MPLRSTHHYAFPPSSLTNALRKMSTAVNGPIRPDLSSFRFRAPFRLSYLASLPCAARPLVCVSSRPCDPVRPTIYIHSLRHTVPQCGWFADRYIYIRRHERSDDCLAFRYDNAVSGIAFDLIRD